MSATNIPIFHGDVRTGGFFLFFFLDFFDPTVLSFA
jgi:hypothetical protein